MAILLPTSRATAEAAEGFFYNFVTMATTKSETYKAFITSSRVVTRKHGHLKEKVVETKKGWSQVRLVKGVKTLKRRLPVYGPHPEDIPVVQVQVTPEKSPISPTKPIPVCVVDDAAWLAIGQELDRNVKLRLAEDGAKSQFRLVLKELVAVQPMFIRQVRRRIKAEDRQLQRSYERWCRRRMYLARRAKAEALSARRWRRSHRHEQRNRKVLNNLVHWLQGGDLHVVQVNNLKVWAHFQSKKDRTEPKCVATSRRHIVERVRKAEISQPKSQLVGEEGFAPQALAKERNVVLLRRLQGRIAYLQTLRMPQRMRDLLSLRQIEKIAFWMRAETIKRRDDRRFSKRCARTQVPDYHLRDLSDDDSDDGVCITLPTDDRIYVTPQMEDKDGEAIAVSNVAGDTTMIEQREASVDNGPLNLHNTWNNLVSTSMAIDDCGPSDRYYLVENFIWKKSYNTGVRLKDYCVPEDIIKILEKQPCVRQFKQHVYWKGDMEFKLTINSNKFSIGQLQMTFFYGSEGDLMFPKRRNVYSMSQNLHALSQAGSSNPSLLRVPFAYHYPYMSINKRNVDNSRLRMGTLTIHVLNQLFSPSMVGDSCNCQLSVRFLNSKFVGQVNQDFGYKSVVGNMDKALAGLAIGAAESYLTHISADANRDLPTAPIMPQPVQIYSAGNLSYGSNVVEHTNAMRLDPRGQTPHLQLPKDEMSIQDVSRTFGFMGTFNWRQSAPSGQLLGCWDASPIWDIGKLSNIVVDGNNYCSLPPVGYIASLFKQWRGTLEYRFDFVANPMYSGSVLIAYIPGVTKPVTLDQAQSSPNTIFVLGEERSFTFVAPFICDRPWWPRPYSGTNDQWDYGPLGSVQMFVVNSLNLMNTIPDIIDVNVYMRAGCDFEVSVPVQPCISSCYFPNYYEVDPVKKVQTYDSGTLLYGYLSLFNG